MKHPLDGVRAKLRRAEEHLDALKAEFDEFVKPNLEPSRTIMIHVKFEEGKGGITWSGAVPPLRWSVILGEFLYCLRPALDHLARQLVIVSGGTPTTRTEFPVFKDEGGFNGKRRGKRRLA